MDSEGTAPVPTRRRLLKGAALATVPYTLLSGTRAAAQTRTDDQPAIDHPAVDNRAVDQSALDYPALDWQPASASNYSRSSRPTAYPVDYVVVHVTQETYADTLSIFRDPEKQVSAHYVVRSSDGHVAQCVSEADIAWHAGNWDYNTRSIGIEHEGWVDRPEYFTNALYEQSALLTAAICTAYGIPKDRTHIIAHHEVPGSDHTDPGPFWDWTRYIRLVNFA